MKIALAIFLTVHCFISSGAVQCSKNLFTVATEPIPNVGVGLGSPKNLDPRAVIVMMHTNCGEYYQAGRVTGVQPNIQVADCNATKNECGAHAHLGDSCNPYGPGNETAALFKVTHLWSESDSETKKDPWSPSMYVSDGDGNGNLTASNFGLPYITYFRLQDKPYIIHSNNASRISCGLIRKLEESEYNVFVTTGFKPINNHQNNIQGDITVITNENGTYVMGKLEGTTGSGGVHIHEGKSCENPGGHYYNAQFVDPWLKTGYDESGVSTFYVPYQGSAFENVEGHALVVHNAEGEKVSCTILKSGLYQDSGSSRIYCALSSTVLMLAALFLYS